MKEEMVENTTRQDAQVHDRQIRDMFTGIAGVYDRMNGILSLGMDARWRWRLAAAIDADASDLLDVCCGTGELLLTAQKMGRGRRHVAADFCEAMIRAGASDHELHRRAAVAVADTQALPFASSSFDVVMSGFGLRNLGDLRRGIVEIHRVLRPGGQLLVLEFFRVRRGALAAPVSAYLGRVVPWVGRLVGKDSSAYGYLPRSMGQFLSVAEFGQLLVECGFQEEPRVESQTLGIAHLVVARRAG